MDNNVKVYIDNQDGIYSAYFNKNDPYITTNNPKEANIDAALAQHLCETTASYNESQDVLYSLFND